MTRPTFETWFMEGKLIPNVHYLEIKNDYSDLEECLKYYINHPHECLKIIENAKAYVEQFKDKRRERLISLLVMKKYFSVTNQNTFLEN
jgi:spore maturation protein CgeB